MSDDSHVAPQLNQGWSCGQVRDELDAWALGALEPDESDAIERHIATCESCRREATAIDGVASLLPFSLAPVSPSSAARHALMARIADEQMAVAAAQSQFSLRPTEPAEPTTASTEPARRFHWAQMLITPLAIALVVMTLWSLQLRDQVDDQGANGGLDTTQTVSMLPEGFQTFNMQSKCEKCKATGKLLADPEEASALMVAWDLEPGEIHQVWCQSEGSQPALVASLDVSDTGEVVQPLVFDQPISGYSRIFVVTHNGEISEIRLGQGGALTPSPAPLRHQ